MIDISERQDILMHYASPYYDPVKAHEYYEQHKHLKGRPTGRLTDEGKQVWKVTKMNIDQAKKIENDEARLVKLSSVQQFQNKAKEQRTIVQAKLTELLNTINDKYKTDTEDLTETQKHQIEVNNRLKKQKAEDIKNKKAREIESLIEDTSDMDEEEIEEYYEKINQKMSKINDKYSKESEYNISDTNAKNNKVREEIKNKKSILSEQKKKDTTKNREDAKQQRERIANELKDNVRKAVGDFQMKKAQIKEKYEGIYQDEYDKIASEYTKPKKSRKK